SSPAAGSSPRASAWASAGPKPPRRAAGPSGSPPRGTDATSVSTAARPLARPRATPGLAGALLANQTEYLTPDFMHWTRSGEIMFMVILGGMGSLFGPVIGAVALLLLEDVLSALTAHWQIVLGPILILVVLFAKRGLFGLLAGKEAQDG